MHRNSAVQLILGNPQTFYQTAGNGPLPGPEELNGFTDIIILHNAQDVVIEHFWPSAQLPYLVEIRDHRPWTGIRTH